MGTFAGEISRRFAFVSAEFVPARVACPRFAAHAADPSVRRLGRPVADRLIPGCKGSCAPNIGQFRRQFLGDLPTSLCCVVCLQLFDQ